MAYNFLGEISYTYICNKLFYKCVFMREYVYICVCACCETL